MSKSSGYKILFVDANEAELQNLASTFSNEGYSVKATPNPEEVLSIARQQHPHLIMLELVMPKIDGIDICADIKRDNTLSKSLIVFYSSREDDYSQIAAFNAGADDYITKPQQKRVLVSRVKAILKRYDMAGSEASKSFKNSSSDLIIDKERFLVILKGEKVTLPRKEFQLLAFMAENPKKVFSRKEISEFIWGDENHAQKRTIDVHIRRLRKKIGVKFIETIKGVGYKLNA